ncbi:MAG: hypothetical protein O3C63_06265 [Cyanobacteria bacterium]|nr:hypothetical protein [Cyanobacteriota bacterium]
MSVNFFSNMIHPAKDALLGMFFANAQNQNPKVPKQKKVLASTEMFNRVFLEGISDKPLATMLVNSAGTDDQKKLLLETALHMVAKTKRRVAVHEEGRKNRNTDTKSFHTSSGNNFKSVQEKLTQVINELVVQFQDSILSTRAQVSEMIDFAKRAVGLNKAEIKELGLVMPQPSA